MVKKNKKIKFLILTIGPGETAQGIAFGKHAIKRGGNVVFAVRVKSNQIFFNGGEKYKVFFADTSEKLRKLWEKEKPDVFVLCNSKAARQYENFFMNFSFQDKVFVTLDSNWLFYRGEKWYSFTEGADKYLIVFPKKIFDSGLKKNGGNYNISDSVMKKIEPVGFIPSYRRISLNLRRKVRKKFDIKKNEKLIFSYLGGFAPAASFKFWALEKLAAAVDNLRKKGLKIKIIHIGDIEKETFEKGKDFIIKNRIYGENEFFLTLASADLVFQHQGLGTLAQAISSNVPVIANVRDLVEEPPRHAHAWEIGPFEKFNLCKMFYRSSSVENVQKGIETLLYDKIEIRKMRNAQKKYYQGGEAKAYRIIRKLLKNKKV